MSALREFLTAAVARGASDLHLKAGQKPIFRVHDELVDAGATPLTAEHLAQIAAQIIPPHQRARFEQEHEADFSLVQEGAGRFRVNVFLSQGAPAIAMRHVKTRIPTFDELHLPTVLKALAGAARGIILICGSTGSGKSTTLAALLQHINTTEHRRIITVEDPIEYVFEDRLSVISQREIGLDTLTFRAALTNILRQDPDVIVIGEMRDASSFTAALSAAETGHLVFSTMHTDTAAQAVSRVLNFFPAEERDQMRMNLAANLRAAICQRLIPAVHGGVRPAVEIMVNTPMVRKLMERNMLDKLSAAVETGGEDRMQTFNQAILQLIKSGEISEEEGLMRCTNPETLKMNLKGIFLDEAKRILNL